MINYRMEIINLLKECLQLYLYVGLFSSDRNVAYGRERGWLK